MERKDLPNPRMAALLSFVVNGLGQIYNGEIKKGLWLIFLSGSMLLSLILGAIFIFWFLFKNFSPVSLLIWGIILFFIGLTGIIMTGIYSISDAYNTAKKMRENEETAE